MAENGAGPAHALVSLVTKRKSGPKAAQVGKSQGRNRLALVSLVADLDRLVEDVAVVIIERLLLVEAMIGGLVVVLLEVVRLVVAAVVIAATVTIAITSLGGSGASAEGGRRESECDEGLTHDHLLEAA
jgi:hypothetical protein